MVTKLKDKIGY